MDVRQLRYFLSIARCGSFSRAAIELNVAQPALSHHVANLEAELGVRLFNRSTRGVETTECGETLIGHAETILRQMTQAARDVQTTSDQPSGTVEIGLPTSVSLELTVPLLMAVQERYPAIELKISENHSGYLAEWVMSGQLDMAVLFDVPEGSPYDLRPLLTEQLYLVTAPGGPAQGRGQVDLSELSDIPLILTGQSHGLRQVLERQSGHSGLRLNIKTEIDSLVAIKKLVAAGYGHAVLPWSAIQQDAREGALAAAMIVSPKLERQVLLASARDWPRSRAAEVIAEVTSEIVATLLESDRWRGRIAPLP